MRLSNESDSSLVDIIPFFLTTMEGFFMKQNLITSTIFTFAIDLEQEAEET